MSLNGLTYNVQTFGCQMNKHDSERVSGLLTSSGMIEVQDIESSDIVVFITCVVRESAETRLLGHVNAVKGIPRNPASPLSSRIVAIGGCMGQRDGEEILKRASNVDVVFGTNNIDDLPKLLEEAIETDEFTTETIKGTKTFSTDLPSKRESEFLAWLPIMTGCDNFCTYCIVPYVRGREKSRPIEDIVEETQAYVSQGVKEITLLGQNVNSYGRDLYGESKFAEVLRRVADTGIERIRFATSHPKDLSDELIECFRDIPNLMPSLHLPVQSGSDEILKQMNRKYTNKAYRELIDKLRDARSDIALSTDIIIGFPGEREQDFQDTFDLVKDIGYNQVFTFKYSPRSGTPAATYSNSVPKDVVSERFDRLFAAVEEGAFKANQYDLGKIEPVLVEGVSKKDSSMLTGRNPRNINVHARIPEGGNPSEFEGKTIDVKIDDAKTWYLRGSIV